MTAFVDLLIETELRLVDRLELSRLELEPSMASARGRWKGDDVRIETRAYRGPTIAYARFATVVGAGLEIANLLCLSHHDIPLPMLGADLVSLGSRSGTSMLAADLSPTLPPGEARAAQLAGLAARMARHAGLPPGGELPAWCSEWFSPFALYTRPDASTMDAAVAAFREIPEEFIELSLRTDRDVDTAAIVAAAQAAYADAHRTDDKGLGMLAKMFGAAWADRYLAEVLFPAATVDAC